MSTSVLLYGITNCDTMKKARRWLDDRAIAYEFRDYKKSAPTRELVESWTKTCGWEVLLNRAGTTFRKLPDAEREGITAQKAIALMVTHPSVIKRPVLDIGGELTVGFSPETYERVFHSSR
jgi:arsenate reductase